MTIETEVRDELTYLVVWYHRLPMGQEEDGELLLNWLLGHYRTTPYRKHTPWLTSIEPCFWPDVCSICGASFGLTAGGRVRRGCPVCRNSRDGQLLFAWRRYSGLDLYCPAFLELEYKYGDYDNETD